MILFACILLFTSSHILLFTCSRICNLVVVLFVDRVIFDEVA